MLATVQERRTDKRGTRERELVLIEHIAELKSGGKEEMVEHEVASSGNGSVSVLVPEMTEGQLVGRICENISFVEDLMRIGCDCPEDIAHLQKNISLDAKWVATKSRQPMAV